MKIAILSDIHGNLEALEAVIADLDLQRPDRVVCLGDLIGYGPDPEAVVRRVMELDIVCVAGNHETALTSSSDRNWMNFLAKENNQETEALLSRQCLDYCACLPRSLVLENCHFVHGCPPDSVLRYLYMLKEQDIRSIMRQSSCWVFFVGHTHELKLVTVSEDSVEWGELREGIVTLDRNRRYLVNVGSVGQPRGGDGRAQYVIWDSGLGTIEVRALAYPAEVTAEKIIARGFPKAYALRLK